MEIIRLLWDCFETVLDFLFGTTFSTSCFDGVLILEIWLLKLDNLINALNFANWGVGATLKVIVWSRHNHDADSGIESNKNRKLDE